MLSNSYLVEHFLVLISPYLCFRLSQICGRPLNTWGSRGSLRKETCTVLLSFPRRSWWESAHSIQAPALIVQVRERCIESHIIIHIQLWHLLVISHHAWVCLIYMQCLILKGWLSQKKKILNSIIYSHKKWFIFYNMLVALIHAITMNREWSFKIVKMFYNFIIKITNVVLWKIWCELYKFAWNIFMN